MLHLLQPSSYEIIPHHMTCYLIRAKTYIVNRLLSLHRCSIIQDMRPCFRCKRHNWTMLQPDIQTALTAAATIFTGTDLNVRLCHECDYLCVLCSNDKLENRWIQTFHSHADRDLYNNSLTAKKMFLSFFKKYKCVYGSFFVKFHSINVVLFLAYSVSVASESPTVWSQDQGFGFVLQESLAHTLSHSVTHTHAHTH